MARNAKGLVTLENLAPTASIYLGERNDGGLILLKTSVEIGGRRQKVYKNAQLAMALTETCYKQGYGAVSANYHVSSSFRATISLIIRHPVLLLHTSHRQIPRACKCKSRNQTKGSHASRSLLLARGIPRAGPPQMGIYNPKQRYMELNARRLSCDKSGLAICVNYNDENRRFPVLNVATACNVTMYFDPCPNVGFTAEMLWGKARFQMLALGDTEDVVRCKNALGFRQDGVSGLVRGVRELYAARAGEKWVEATIGIIKEAEGMILERAGVAVEGEYDDLGVGEQNFINSVSENVCG